MFCYHHDTAALEGMNMQTGIYSQRVLTADKKTDN